MHEERTPVSYDGSGKCGCCSQSKLDSPLVWIVNVEERPFWPCEYKERAGRGYVCGVYARFCLEALKGVSLGLAGLIATFTLTAAIISRDPHRPPPGKQKEALCQVPVAPQRADSCPHPLAMTWSTSSVTETAAYLITFSCPLFGNWKTRLIQRRQPTRALRPLWQVLEQYWIPVLVCVPNTNLFIFANETGVEGWDFYNIRHYAF